MEANSGNLRENSSKDTNKVANYDLKICSPDVSSSKSSGGMLNWADRFSLRSSVLGSSLGHQLNKEVQDSSSKSFTLKPPRLSNPFSKSTDNDKEVDIESKDKAEVEPNLSPEKDELPESSSTEKSDTVGSSQLTVRNSSMTQVSFVPLGWNAGGVSPSVAPSSQALGSFVFGQNLRDKVEGAKTDDDNKDKEESIPSVSHHHENNVEVKSNGTTSEMLFSSAVKNDSVDGKAIESNKSLSEAAREYEEARSIKRKFEPVQLITGEEHEQNVLQMNCKLFAYDKVSSGWQERGRGLLRLNDSTSSGSRLIIRSHGSLRVLINTKVWSDMVVQRASSKSLRITAVDSSEVVKVFLISASQTEVDELQRYLESRVKKLDKINDRTDIGQSIHMKKLRTNSDDSS